MADASGSGGLGALTLGAVAGVAVVLGGVVLFQLGVFGTGQPGGEAANGQAGGQAARGSEEFTGDGEESGQPLQNRTANAPVDVEDDSAAAEAEPVENAAVSKEPAAEETAVSVDPDPAAAAEVPTVTAGAEAEIAPVEVPAAGEEIALAAPSDPAADESKEDIFVLQAPELDLVRVDRDGAVVIAGRAQEGVRVSVLLDGVVLEQLEVPAGGEFVSLTTIAPSADARVVSLLAEHGGQQSASGDTFILAPVSPAAPEIASGAGTGVPAEAAAAAPVSADQVAVLEPAAGAETAQPAAPAVEAEPDGAGAAEDGTAEAGGMAAAGDQQRTAPAAQTPPVAADPAAPQLQGQAVAVLRAGQDGIEVVQPAVPDDPELSDEVALDAISYNGAGAVQLTGRARPKSRVRVYVDNAQVAEIDTADDGRWKGELENVPPGLYTLRVDEIEPGSGKVVSRLETPFKREAPDALPQPAGDAAPDQPVPLVRAVTVQKGDTLWAISQEKFGSGFLYVRVFEANKGAIRNPDLIYPGQVFTIPE
ncbi:LysM peptidoglycan-binding domain-containing protein [Leisingera aquaemixtae]|uniref:LysM peptidoglycan-binding domain-containing protein n=1 Tax=Leisingera aquaemixtae TaxID=1396826 RepID=UPI0039845244